MFTFGHQFPTSSEDFAARAAHLRRLDTLAKWGELRPVDLSPEGEELAVDVARYLAFWNEARA